MNKKLLRQALSELGKKGGPARARALTPARRKEIASNAAKARWSKPRKGGKA